LAPYDYGARFYDAVTVTAPLDKFIIKNFGSVNNLHFYTLEEAKAIWIAGFALKTVKVVTEKGRVFILK